MTREPRRLRVLLMSWWKRACQFFKACRRGVARLLGRDPLKSVKLYKASNPFWLTDASINDKGDLVVTSGDASNEWSKIVPAAHKAALLKALNGVTIDQAWGDKADARLLRALSAMFAGEKNPYEDIKVFLERHAIPARDSSWLWSGN